MKDLTVLSVPEIREVLVKAGMRPEAVKALGSSFDLVSEDDVQSKFSGEFTRNLMETGYTYKPGRRVCYHFARWAVGWLHFFNSEQPDQSDNGVAAGILGVPTRGEVYVVVIHQSDAEVCYAQVYNPQRDERGIAMTPVDLSPEDWRNADADF